MENQLTTICMCIGNTDNKLTQQQWAKFSAQVEKAIGRHIFNNHFYFKGAPPTWAPYQNVCFIFGIFPNVIEKLKLLLIEIRNQYQQDSISWLEGETQFI